MGQVHGKQIKNSSVLLNKINPSTGQTLTLVGTSKIQQPQAPSIGDDLANKAYVDSVAAGLNTKEAVNLATTGNITATYSNGTAGVGATLLGSPALTLDGVAISLSDRILVKNQTNAFENGIYDVTTAGANWVLTRAVDFDGSPVNEVNGGEFTFIMSGSTLADTGWVVSSPSGVNATIGTTPIIWVQFSSAGVITAGTGLEQAGVDINFQTGDNSLTVGLTNSIVNVDGTTIQTGASGIEVISGGITSTQLASSVAGVGLTGGAGFALDVNLGPNNGLTFSGDNIVVDGTLLAGTGITWDGTAFNTTSGDITGVTAGAGLSGGGTSGSVTLDVNLGPNNGLTFSGDNIVVDGTLLAGTGITWDGTAFNTTSGDITGVTAGAGLSGGGTSGSVTLDVNLGANGGLTFSGDNIVADYTSLSSTLAGNGLVQNGITLDVNVGNGLLIVSDIVEAALVLNSGLTFSAGAIDLSVGTGLAISSGNVITDTSLSLLTGDLINSGVATGSSIQAALEAMDVTLGTVEVSENISLDLSPVPAAIFTTGINIVNTTSLITNSDGDAWLTLNGVSQVIGSATSSAWFWTSDGGVTARANKTPLIGDQLAVNINTLGYSISGSSTDNDIIEVKYDSLA